jgi:hypothetical protein
MIRSLSEVEQDYAFSQGFIEEWLKNAPSQVKEHLAIFVSGLQAYREKFLSIQEDYDSLLLKYNQLTATSAQYLQFIQTQKQQLDEALIREQQAYHKDGKEILLET